MQIYAKKVNVFAKEVNGFWGSSNNTKVKVIKKGNIKLETKCKFLYMRKHIQPDNNPPTIPDINVGAELIINDGMFKNITLS